MKLLTKTFLLSMMVLCALSVSAQKLGHVNSASLLEIHPKLPEANAELEAFQKSESTAFQTKAEAFQAKVDLYLKDNEEGRLSKIEAEALEQKLGQEQQELATTEQQVQFKFAQKREQLVQPILIELGDAIKAVGKEGGYLFIFDTSAGGTILYSQESDDITDMVKTKLGW